MLKKPEGYSPEFWDQQQAEFAGERESIERQRDEAKRLIAKELRDRARIFVFDLGGVQDPGKAGDETLAKELRELQFGGSDRATYGQTIRSLLGFEQGDPQLTIWEAFRNQKIDLGSLPYPDIWVTSGGPAMPSELNLGNKTENTKWLKRVTAVMKELKEAGVPGLAVCLGHQLWNYMEGAGVGKVKKDREFGSPDIVGTEAGKDLQILQGFWDDEGKTTIAASHSEGVLNPPSGKNIQVVAWNDYMPYQASAHPLHEGQTVEEADKEDSLAVSIQNHPDVLARWLHVLKLVRGPAMEAEGLDPKNILLRNTPRARSVWTNLLALTARRIKKREGSGLEI